MNILIPVPGNFGCRLFKNEMLYTKTYFLLFNIQLSAQQIRMTKTIAISGRGTTCIIENASHFELQSYSWQKIDENVNFKIFLIAS